MSRQIHPAPLAVRTIEDSTVVKVLGHNVSLDNEVAAAFGDQLLAVAEQYGPRRMILDLGGVHHLSSRALAQLIGVNRRLRARGGQLSVRNVSRQVYEVFAVTNRTGLLDVYERRASDVELAPPDRPDQPLGVLLADEDKGVRNMLGVALRGYGFAVWPAATGPEAVALYREHQRTIHLALLAVGTSRLDGPGTLAALHGLNPQLPCCFMSAGDCSYTEDALLKLGAAGVFRKPFSVSQVLQTLYRLALGSSLPRQAEPNDERKPVPF
jgi:anti-anti-sigma factor